LQSTNNLVNRFDYVGLTDCGYKGGFPLDKPLVLLGVVHIKGSGEFLQYFLCLLSFFL
jgi:hypothetical protein